MSGIFRDNILAGKTAYVAGGSSGINLGIAERLAGQGAHVVLVSRSEDRVAGAAAAIAASGGSATGIAADVRDYDAIAASFAAVATERGAIDIVISGAAGNFLAPARKLSANGFKTVVDIDLLGTFNVFRASFEHLRKPGASLIAITSDHAINVKPFQVHVCAAKAGVDMVTRCLAMEWGPAGVRVNGISPGPISGTEGMARLAADPAAESRIKSEIPMRDYGTKQDVADLALFLCSDAARNISGAIYNVDGGYSLGDASLDALDDDPRSYALR